MFLYVIASDSVRKKVRMEVRMCEWNANESAFCSQFARCSQRFCEWKSVIVGYLVERVSVARPGKADHLAREDERVHQLAELGRGEVEVL